MYGDFSNIPNKYKMTILIVVIFFVLVVWMVLNPNSDSGDVW